jgi:hypothetical protein
MDCPTHSTMHQAGSTDSRKAAGGSGAARARVPSVDRFCEPVRVPRAFGVTCRSHFLALECSCSAIHLTASCSVAKPLTTSVSPSGQRISTPQPEPGFFRATKTGRCSDIPRIWACGGPVQASYPATIKLTTTLEMGRLPGAGAGSGFAGFMCAGRSAPANPWIGTCLAGTRETPRRGLSARR